MPATVSDRGAELLGDLPAYYATDPVVLAVQDAIGRESQRLQDAAEAILRGMTPAVDSDAYGLLTVWEKMLGLGPLVGATDADRHTRIAATLRGRRVAAGRDWVSALTAAIGSDNWSHTEVDPYSVTILLPGASGTISALQTLALARLITPANMSISVIYDQGFVIGTSQIGVSHL